MSRLALCAALILIPMLAVADYARDFLELPRTAREMAMGGRIGNPAIPALEGASIEMSHMEIKGLERFSYASIGWDLGEIGVLSVGWARLGVSDIPIYPELPGSHEERLVNPYMRSDFKPIGFLSDVEEAFSITYSILPPRFVKYYSERALLSLGFSLKLFRQRMGGMRGSGSGMDFGMILSLRDVGGWKVELGAAIEDIASSSIKWRGGRKELIPPDMRLMFSAGKKLGVARFLVVLSLRTRYSPGVSVGAELVLGDALSLRAGLRGSEPGFGAGISIGRVELSYGMGLWDLSMAHLVSFKARF